MTRNKRIMGWLIGLFVLFPVFVFLYNKITVHKNDSEKCFPFYYNRIIQYPIEIPKISNSYSDTLNVNFRHYRLGASPIGFKGLNGDIISVSFIDLTRKKHFKINLYDVDKQKFYSLSDVLEGEEINAYINQDDMNNPNYGTKENPIFIFNYSGVRKKIAMESSDKDDHLVMESLEPADAEYKHNVWVYLAYILSKEEFKHRFLKE